MGTCYRCKKYVNNTKIFCFHIENRMSALGPPKERQLCGDCVNDFWTWVEQPKLKMISQDILEKRRQLREKDAELKKKNKELKRRSAQLRRREKNVQSIRKVA